MTVLASTIAADAARLLGDEDYDRWTAAHHLANINEGQVVVANLKPDATAYRGTWRLVAGANQAIPDGVVTDPSGTVLPKGLVLLDLYRNMGTAGTSAGRAIEKIDRAVLNSTDLFWADADTNADVKNFIYDERNPSKFEVYPPQPAVTGYVNGLFSTLPTAIAAIGNAISLSDEYAPLLTLYDLYACYRMDAGDSLYAFNRQLNFWNEFVTGLGRLDLVRKASSPNVHRPDPSPSQRTNDKGQPWQI